MWIKDIPKDLSTFHSKIKSIFNSCIFDFKKVQHTISQARKYTATLEKHIPSQHSRMSHRVRIIIKQRSQFFYTIIAIISDIVQLIGNHKHLVQRFKHVEVFPAIPFNEQFGFITSIPYILKAKLTTSAILTENDLSCIQKASSELQHVI